MTASAVRLPPAGLYLLMLLCAWLPAQAAEAPLDPDQCQFGFELRTRWGQKLQGLFPRYEGESRKLPDGRNQVRLKMYTRDVDVVGNPRYSEWARGEQFFDAARHPAIEFISKPFNGTLLGQGGALVGELTVRGITRPATLQVAPATCERHGYDCDIVVTGEISRSDFGMDGWKMALHDQVVLTLFARLKDPGN